ncbi:MAG: ABC transporter permease [Intrasporangium sp.]|uniref:ABC transporter permease n=1 Tax=Intrasporangium sp. TaxID=1925024 RepID=UPI0026481B78|nr:ABC transporter permease [Intrasporangium sp.]MDN5796882.1 ABC transporter permease [Intrasporangium sp.]
MGRVIARRLLQAIPILIGLSVLMFAWVRALPGGPAEALVRADASAAEVEAVRESLGLNRPIWIQYLAYLKQVVQFDFGTSLMSRQPVRAEMIDRFPASIELAVSAMIFALVIGVPLGYYAARRYGSALDHLFVASSLIGITIPVFFMAYLLKFVFAVQLGWLPTTGRSNARVESDHPTGFYVLDGLLTGNLGASWDAIQHLILPAIALGTIPLAIIVRMTRATVLDVMNEDYVRTAEAKGLTKFRISSRHVMRNALIPLVTIVGLQLGLLMSGTVLTETVFSFPGVGSFVAGALFARDYPTIQGFVVVIAVMYIIVNLVVDIAYAYIDPRVRAS